MPSALSWLPWPSLSWLCLKIIILLRKFLKILWWLKLKLKAIRKPRMPFLLLKKFKAGNGINKVSASQRMRTGKGKMRNCHHIQYKGPCITYHEDNGVIKAFRTSLELLCIM